MFNKEFISKETMKRHIMEVSEYRNTTYQRQKQVLILRIPNMPVRKPL